MLAKSAPHGRCKGFLLIQGIFGSACIMAEQSLCVLLAQADLDEQGTLGFSFQKTLTWKAFELNLLFYICKPVMGGPLPIPEMSSRHFSYHPHAKHLAY